ncbi:MAG: hypothetical protein KDC80_15575 [Saprospiraceae bacterium]|nr:hypothetical protein [Saprospiraceae bacterium]
MEAKIDLIDILFRGDVLEILSTMSDEICNQGCRFITQGGFHPGILAPFIRLAADDFDVLEEARIFMAMDPIFEKPDSIKEMLYEVIHAKAMLLEESQWRIGSYRDAHQWTFKHHFGKKSCYPLNMPEIHGLEKDLGLKYAAVYAAGFDHYIDQFLFPLVMILGKINGNLAQNLGSRLFYNHIRKYGDRKPRVELCLQAKGLKSNLKKEIIWSLVHDDGFQLTALAVVALLNQLLKKPLEEPGLYLMGQITNHQELFSDLSKMGVIIKKQDPALR